jgi:hypothetical protein
MNDRAPKLRIYAMTGFIGCKCETCGWASTTPYVNGERTDQTVRRAFSTHKCHLEDEQRALADRAPLQAIATA